MCKGEKRGRTRPREGDVERERGESDTHKRGVGSVKRAMRRRKGGGGVLKKRGRRVCRKSDEKGRVKKRGSIQRNARREGKDDD